MRRARVALLGLLIAACTTPLEMGERLYQEGDRLGAIEVWRSVLEDDSENPVILARIAVVEEEFQQLVVRYKKRASYFEGKDRLAEAILSYRLALKLQPDDAPALAHVQQLARTLATRKAELETAYRVSFDEKDLAAARLELDRLRALDPFDPQLESEQRRLEDALRAEVNHRLATGRLGLAAGNHASARQAFHAALALEPDNESARGYLSYIATIRRESQASGEEPAAFDAPEAFASDAEIRAEGFYQNGLAAERAGDLYTAIRHDQRALEADSGHAAAQSHLAAIRRRLAGEVEPLIEAGRRWFRSEDLQPALELWEQALLIDPNNERARAYIERAKRQLENLERLRSEPDVASGRD